MKESTTPTGQDQRSETRERPAASNKAATVSRAIFGIIMIVIYVGMGILLLINFFDWGASWRWATICLGILFVIYGFWRAYRQFKGIDSSF